jgi:hypothetical protein
MMEAVRTSETSVHFNVSTRCYIPEDSKLHTRRREDLKSDKDTTRSTLNFEDVTFATKRKGLQCTNIVNSGTNYGLR